MQRAVVCSFKETRIRVGTAHTPDDGSFAEPSQYEYVYVAFDDDGDEVDHFQRNSYYLNLTPEEAGGFELDGRYTISIG